MHDQCLLGRVEWALFWGVEHDSLRHRWAYRIDRDDRIHVIDLHLLRTEKVTE